MTGTMFSRAFFRLPLIVLVFLGSLSVVRAEPDRLKVGVFDLPPLAFKDETGRWVGLAVDLWEEVSARTGVDFDYVEMPLERAMGALARGEIDLAIGEIAVSAERERVIDFTQAFLENPAAVALPHGSRYPGGWDLWEELSQHGLFTVLLVMLGGLVVFSLLLWVFERRVNEGHFGGHPLRGLGSAVWFSAVTMTTVGYGDKTPQTGVGRFLAFLWMFFGILLVSAFTGTVASSLTVSRLNHSINHLGDLSRFRNGVMEGSLAQGALNQAGIPTVAFPTVESGLEALAKKRVTAFVGGDLTLRYLVGQTYPETLVVDSLPMARVRYAMAARPGLRQFSEINIALIAVTSEDQWQRTVSRWSGPPEQK